MLNELRKLAEMPATPDDYDGPYDIVKIWHPSADKDRETVGRVATLEEAQEICRDPETSYKPADRPTSEWYFFGYEETSSRTRRFKLFRNF